MSNAFSHPSEAELLAVADRNLADAVKEDALLHVADCRLCRGVVTDYEEALRFWDDEHRAEKQAWLVAPVSWADLRVRMREEDKRATRPQPILIRAERTSQPRKLTSVRRWVPPAIAAVLLVGAVSLWRQSETVVSAAELLDRARRAPASTTAHRRPLRIKTIKAVYVRPAVGASKTPQRIAAELQSIGTRLEASGFDWDDPFTARAFAEWRNTLAVKDDRVVIQNGREGKLYEVRTQTPNGDLARATLTLRASDLKPVREVLQFRNNDSIEIQEALESDLVSGGSVSELQPAPTGAGVPAADAIPGSPVVGASEELKTLARLHELNADLGEPVEVSRSSDGTHVLVKGLGLSQDREAALRRSLADLAFVRFEFSSPEATSGDSPRQPARVASGRRREFEAWISDRVGHADAQAIAENSLDASEMLLAHSHAIRALASRFGPELKLDASDQALLRRIVSDHSRRAAALSVRLRSTLEPLTGRGEVHAAAASGTWQDIAPRLVTAALQLDQALSRAFASSTNESPEDIFRQARESLADAARLTAALESALRESR